MPLEKVDLKDYVKKTEGWSGADIEAVCRNAGVLAIKRVYKSSKKMELKVTKADFDSALEEVSKNSNKEIFKEVKKEKKLEKKEVKKLNKKK